MNNIPSSLVTCVIPHGGSSRYLLETLKSAVEQRFAETILVNDGGPLPPIEALTKPFPEIRVVQLDQPAGAANARNVGIRACKTPYVVLLDHDDVLCKDYLPEISEWVVKNQLRCGAARMRYIGDDSRRVGVVVSRATDFFLPSGFFSEVSLIEEVGFFSDSISEDIIFFKDVQKRTTLRTCPHSTVLYRIHAQSGGSTNAKAWWACNQLLPLYFEGALTLPEVNLLAREFADRGVVPAQFESRLRGKGIATARLLSRSAYACWLNRDLVGMLRHGVQMTRFIPEVSKIVGRKWNLGC
jgi:glycosyltransferase involved in cell wall biosynthesis